jgi:hypothetical protein
MPDEGVDEFSALKIVKQFFGIVLGLEIPSFPFAVLVAELAHAADSLSGLARNRIRGASSALVDDRTSVHLFRDYNAGPMKKTTPLSILPFRNGPFGPEERAAIDVPGEFTRVR